MKSIRRLVALPFVASVSLEVHAQQAPAPADQAAARENTEWKLRHNSNKMRAYVWHTFLPSSVGR